MPYAGGFAFDGLARLAVAENQPHRALRLAGAARAAHERVGTSAGPAYGEYVRRAIEPARRLLGAAAAERAYQRGMALALSEAIAGGLRRNPQADIPAGTRTIGNHLSSAYRKLAVASRTAAVREARHLGLLH